MKLKYLQVGSGSTRELTHGVPYVPPIIPFHEQPTVEQVTVNVEATFDGVLDVIHEKNPSKFVQTVLMFDKIATEKRIHWDNTATEFVNEDDMEELFQKLDDARRTGSPCRRGEKVSVCFQVCDVMQFYFHFRT